MTTQERQAVAALVAAAKEAKRKLSAANRYDGILDFGDAIAGVEELPGFSATEEKPEPVPEYDPRKMAYDFLNHPLCVQINIARDAGLMIQSDYELNPSDFAKRVFARAKAEDKMQQLNTAIKKAPTP